MIVIAYQKDSGLEIPIVIAQIKFHRYSKGHSAVKTEFYLRWSDEDATIRTLKGEEDEIATMPLHGAMRTLDLLMQGDFFTLKNGWASGPFTFRQIDDVISLRPFEGDLNNTKYYRKAEQE